MSLLVSKPSAATLPVTAANEGPRNARIQTAVGRFGTSILLLTAVALPIAFTPIQHARSAAPHKIDTNPVRDPLPPGAVGRLAAGQGISGPITGLIISTDGKSVVTLGKDKKLRFWDIRTKSETRNLDLPANTAYGALLDSKRALLETKEGALIVWDIEKKRTLTKIQREHEPLGLVRYHFSTFAPRILTVDFRGNGLNLDQHARFYDLDTGAELRGIEDKWTKRPMAEDEKESLRFLVQGEKGYPMAATITVRGPGNFGLGGVAYRYSIRYKESADERALSWNTKIAEPNQMWQVIGFTPDERAVISFQSGDPAHIILHEAITGRERCRFKVPQKGYDGLESSMHALSKKGDLLAVGTAESGTVVLDVVHAKEIVRLDGKQGAVCCVAFDPNTPELFTAGSDGTVLIWDISEHVQKTRQTVGDGRTKGDASISWTITNRSVPFDFH